MYRDSIAVEGQNCWRRAHASKVAFLVDADSYFPAFMSAAAKAQRCIYILGWDIDSRLRLNPQRKQIPDVTLKSFLYNLVDANKDLHIYILTWDFSMIYVFERELAPVFKPDWLTHSRIHFRLDSTHSPFGSHHQKIVVIDDAVAFSGGMDLTARRWDTPEHKSNDGRRIDPSGSLYHPFHDVQIAVEGDAAAALGTIARDRWERAVHDRLKPPRTQNKPWPDGVTPDMTDVNVIISRTELDRGVASIKEVEALFLDMIKAAQKTMYIENQYFTSTKIAEAIAARLREAEGPEIVMLLPRQSAGWLEENTMGLYRQRLIQMLQKTDAFQRLSIYCPSQSNLEIHSKVFVVDDNIVRIGSANLSNRSLGFDTECDIAIEAGGEARVITAIENFRHRLLAEHLHTNPEEVAKTKQDKQSLSGAVEALRLKTQSLERIEAENGEIEMPICDATICDPETPIDADRVLQFMLPDEMKKPSRGRLMAIVGILAVLAGIAIAWRWTPLGDWLNPDTLSSAIAPIRNSLWSPAAVILGFAVLGIVVPVTILILSTLIVFDPLPGFFYSLAGCVLSAIVTYKIGHMLGRDTIRRIAGKKINLVSRHLVRHGFFAITFVRAAAIAPFSVINIIAGASHIRFLDFILGTLAGMTPGLIALTILTDRMGAAIRQPNMTTISVLVAIILVMIAISLWLMKKIANPAKSKMEVKRP